MAEFKEARDALRALVTRVFPDARPSTKWQGIEAWAAPRPAGAIAEASGGTYDPEAIVIGIADRKAGPTIYFLDPGDYFALQTHKGILEASGFRLGRGCIYAGKGPLPTKALEALFRATRARDAALAKGGPKKRAAKAPAKRARARAAPEGAASKVDAYLAALPAPQRMALERLRGLVTRAAPQATETMSYGMPTWRHAGRNLVHRAAFSEHCSFFPGGTIHKIPKKDLAKWKTSKGTIQFAPNKPLPAALVKKIVAMRVAENEALAAKRAKKPTRSRTSR